MSILIKGMEMPKSCYKCPLRRRDGMDIVCPVAHERFSVTDVNFLEYRLDSCPLIPVPPHRRCIDADAIVKAIEADVIWKSQAINEYDSGIRAGGRAIKQMVKNAPTIIPAEEGE